LNTDAREQCNRLSTGKSLKGNKVSTRVAPHLQQNDEELARAQDGRYLNVVALFVLIDAETTNLRF